MSADKFEYVKSLLCVKSVVFNKGFFVLLSILQNTSNNNIDIVMSVHPVVEGICEEPYTRVVNPVIKIIIPTQSFFTGCFFIFLSLLRYKTAMINVKTPRIAAIRNKSRQPRCCVIIPFRRGPKANPVYTAETEIPNTRPLLSGGNDDTRIACPVVPVKAAPIPCRNRAAINQKPSGARKHIIDDVVKITMPSLNSLLLSLLSPHTPEGSINSAIPRMNDVIIQLS